MPADPYGAAATGPAARRPDRPASGMARQERREVRARRHRPDAGAAAAVRDAERLVQVEVRHVGAELARPGQARPARSGWRRPRRPGRPPRARRADLADGLLEHAVRGRVGHHDRGDRARCAASLARRSPRSIAPSEPHLTTTTRSPASTALAALVPCADSGIRQTVRSGCALRPVVGADRQQAR